MSRGQVLPIVGLAAVILAGAAAIAVDVGYLRYQQRIQQGATDSAAIAAASEVLYPSANDVTAAAKSDASVNGFTDDGNAVIVTVNNPPTSGPYAADATAVEVSVKKKDPLFFANVFGMGTQWVQTRAVARVTTNENVCIYALSGDITLHGGGGGGIQAPTCGLVTNANFNVTGLATVNALTIGYVGTGPGGGSYPLGQPHQMVAVADPCQTYPGCRYLAGLTAAQLHTGCMPQSPLPNPVPPGEYCSAFSPDGKTLSPGLFVLDAGMSLAGSSTVSGSGVTIYNLGAFSLSGNASVDLSAPTTGSTAGIVYFQPPANASAATINGRAGTDNLLGAVYMPSAALTFNGNVPNMTFLIAASITMNGGGMGAGPSQSFAGIPHATLAE